MSWPDFLFLGAPRSGTTLLYEALTQHPQLWLSPVKEPLYFLDPAYPVWRVGTRSAYEALFSGRRRDQRAGEASTLYLYDPTAPRRIREALPEARLLAVLRQPIDRAYSQYTFQRLLGTEPCASFEEALAAEPQRHNPFLRYLGVGRYAEQVERYLEHFPPDRLLILLYDDLRQDLSGTLQRVFDFLDVDAGVQPSVRRGVNASGVPRHESLYRLAHRAARPLKAMLPPPLVRALQTRADAALLQRPPRLDPTLRTRLLEDGWADEIRALSRLLGRPLDMWLS
jgi:hypothetical protein